MKLRYLILLLLVSLTSMAQEVVTVGEPGDTLEMQAFQIVTPAGARKIFNDANYNLVVSNDTIFSSTDTLIIQNYILITDSDTIQWNAAYSWGDHSAAGYMKNDDFGDSLLNYDTNYVHTIGNDTCYGIYKFNSTEGWGYADINGSYIISLVPGDFGFVLNPEEGLYFTNGNGDLNGNCYNREALILKDPYSIYDINIRSVSLTESRGMYFPDISDTIAVKSQLPDTSNISDSLRLAWNNLNDKLNSSDFADSLKNCHDTVSVSVLHACSELVLDADEISIRKNNISSPATDTTRIIYNIVDYQADVTSPVYNYTDYIYCRADSGYRYDKLYMGGLKILAHNYNDSIGGLFQIFNTNIYNYGGYVKRQRNYFLNNTLASWRNAYTVEQQGLRTDLNIAAKTGFSSTATDVKGLYSYITFGSMASANQGDVIIPDAVGIDIEFGDFTYGTKTIENTKGLYIHGNSIGGTTQNYGIYQDWGRANYFSADTNTFDGNVNITYGNAIKQNNVNLIRIPAGSSSSLCFGNSGNQTFSGTNFVMGNSAGQALTDGTFNILFGSNAGQTLTTGDYNIFLGGSAGGNATGNGNVFIGYLAGCYKTTNDYNVFIGYAAGFSNTSGTSNFALGYYSQAYNQSGSFNVTIGTQTGYGSSSNSYNNNTFIGHQTGYKNRTGSNNTSIGFQSGYENLTGNGNVFIGYQSGYNETTSNKLYIDNSSTDTPLIYGEFDTDIIKINGTLNISDNPFLPKIYSQADEPDIPINSTAYWMDTDDAKYYLILDISGTQKKVELIP
ncbi:MAG: hypothetical protein KJ607_03170 [Bacteroidetes bacterium]|nr:hypothetical protein [Bacteroidota bacterium]